MFNKKDATFEECLGIFFFLSVSWKKKKLPVTNYWSCRLRQTIRPCILIYISFLTQLILIFFFLRAKATLVVQKVKVFALLAAGLSVLQGKL